jgi:transcriptional regulator with XRE-family HTH domain
MKSRAGDRFKFRPELGVRLRELRQKAGLTQQMLAVAMGCQCKGNHRVVSRLENGRMANPGIGLVADYLRACRSSFVDILDVLERYTARPTVIEVETQQAILGDREYLPAKLKRAMERYDRRTTGQAEADGKAVPEREERVGRARNFGLSQVWARRVRRMVVSVVEAQRPYRGQLIEAYLQNYGGAVWRILNLTRKQRKDRRQAMLDAAIEPYLVEGGPDPRQLDAVRKMLFGYFRRAELAGELDSKPVLAAGEEGLGRGFQPKPDTRPERDAWDKARQELLGQLWQEMLKRPELSGIQSQRLTLWQSLVRQLASIVDHEAPESEECRKQVEALATDEHYTRRGRDPALVNRLAAVVIPRWESLRSTLGPHPLGRVRPPG